jgi:hypothetical protein
MIGYYTPYLFIVKSATTERGIPEHKAVFLLSIIGKSKNFIRIKKPFCFSPPGFSNTAARFASGWITKMPYMSPLLVNNIGLTIAGLATLFVPFCTTHGLLITYCIIWGGFIGKNFLFIFENYFLILAFHVSLSPVIVCQLVGLELFSSALGLTLMFRGITSLITPPVSFIFFSIDFLGNFSLDYGRYSRCNIKF